MRILCGRNQFKLIRIQCTLFLLCRQVFDKLTIFESSAQYPSRTSSGFLTKISNAFEALQESEWTFLMSTAAETCENLHEN